MEKRAGSGRWFLFWVGIGALFWVSLACVLVGLVGCMYVSGELQSESSARVTFLDVGQGLAVLMEYEGRFALYDAGPDSVGVMDSLKARGVDTLQWAVVTHYHRDHAGGLLELEAAGGTSKTRPVVKRLYVGLDTTGGFIRDSLLRLAQRFGIPVDTIFRGRDLQLAGRIGSDGNLRLKAVWPPEFLPLGGNESSVVLVGRLESSDRQTTEGTFLLTGDLDSVSERRLLELSPSLEADLLQVPHHGSAGSSSLGFLTMVSPRYAAISVGKENGYGHPTSSVLRKLNAVIGDSSAVYRTDMNGSIDFQIVPEAGILR